MRILELFWNAYVTSWRIYVSHFGSWDYITLTDFTERLNEFQALRKTAFPRKLLCDCRGEDNANVLAAT